MAKTSKFENTLMDIADFVDSNVYLRSIKDAFTDYVPFIIAGSFGSLLNALIASQTTGLAKWVPALSNLAPAFTAMNFAAVSCMTIPIILLIAMNLAKAKKMPPFITGVLAVICYFAMVPNTITVTIQEATGKASGLSGGVLGAWVCWWLCSSPTCSIGSPVLKRSRSKCRHLFRQALQTPLTS